MAVATKFEIHPLAELIPAMSDEEFTELREDIRENGLREPVTLYMDQLLDGRHRARACEELGIEPATREYTGNEPADYVISLNLRRRHLTVGQRAAAALALLDYEKEQARTRERSGVRTLPATEGRVDRHQAESTAKAGEKLGVSRSSVERAAKVAEERPDLHEKVKSGEMSVGGAFEQVTGKRIKDGTPIDGRSKAAQRAATKPNKREAAQSVKRLGNLIQTFTNTHMLLRETNVDAAVQTIKPEEAAEWASQLRNVRIDLTRLITTLERPE